MSEVEHPFVPSMEELEWPTEIKAHQDDWQATRFAPHTWVKREGPPCCSYCGSVHPWVLYELLRTNPYRPNPIYEMTKDLAPGTYGIKPSEPWYGAEFADWKYGWPHKLYLSNGHGGKFYTLHFLDLGGTPIFEHLSTLVHAHTGIRFLYYPARNEGRGQLGYVGGGRRQ